MVKPPIRVAASERGGLDCSAVRILSWYILRQHLVPFLLGFGVITFILEMDVLFDYLDLVINRGSRSRRCCSCLRSRWGS